MLKTSVAMLKNINTDNVSTIVVISGAAIIAGSSFNFFAIIGNIHPNSFAIITVQISVTPTTKAIFASWYCNIILTEFAIDNTIPTTIATLISFQIALKISFVVISFIANPLIIRVEVCEPQFPPVSIIIGINATNKGKVEIAASKFSITSPCYHR